MRPKGEELGLPRLKLMWADGAYTCGFREWAEEEQEVAPKAVRWWISKRGGERRGTH